jgi:PAS domain-containing protein
MPRVIPTPAYAPPSAIVPVVAASPSLTVFLSRSVYGWRPGGVLIGSLTGRQITETPMIIKTATNTWIGEVRPEKDKWKIVQEGRPPLYVPAESAALYKINSPPSNNHVAAYECRADGACTFANSHLSRLLGLSPGEIEGIGWLRAIGQSVQEKQIAWFNWQSAIEKLSLHSQDYHVVNQSTLTVSNCRTLAVVETVRGKPALYRGIVFQK